MLLHRFWHSAAPKLNLECGAHTHNTQHKWCVYEVSVGLWNKAIKQDRIGLQTCAMSHCLPQLGDAGMLLVGVLILGGRIITGLGVLTRKM